MVSGYTKGPWLRDGRTVYALQDSKSKFVDKENRFSAGFYSGNGCPEAEVIANATLAAAAPELLEALELILSYHDDGNCKLHKEDVAMARAAIAKALGNH